MLLFPDTADESYPVPVKLTWGEVDFLPVTWITRFFNALRLTAIKQLHFSYDLLKQVLYLFSSKTIVFDRSKIPMDAWCVLTSSDHKVSISVIKMDTVLKSVRCSIPVRSVVMTIVHVSVIPVLLD